MKARRQFFKVPDQKKMTIVPWTIFGYNALDRFLPFLCLISLFKLPNLLSSSWKYIWIEDFNHFGIYLLRKAVSQKPKFPTPCFICQTFPNIFFILAHPSEFIMFYFLLKQPNLGDYGNYAFHTCRGVDPGSTRSFFFNPKSLEPGGLRVLEEKKQVSVGLGAPGSTPLHVWNFAITSYLRFAH